MEGVFVCLPLLILQHAVFSVTAVTLSTDGTFVENSDATFLCDFTATWDPATSRQWTGPGSSSLISNGVSTDVNKYVEDISNAAANKQFAMTIKNYNSADNGIYQCQYGFPTSNTITLEKSNTEVHPATNPLEDSSITIPTAPAAISLSITIAGIRPNASASYNLTDSSGILKVNGNANVTSTNDPNMMTETSSLQIDIPEPTSAGDIFTITLLVGTYTQTKQWIIQANPSPNCDCTPEQVLLALSIVLMCVVLIHSWMVFFYTKGIIKWNVKVISKCDDDKSPVNIIVVTIAITLFCVLGMVLCAVALHICQKCTLEDNTSLILAIVGFVLVVVGLVLDILHVCLFKKKTAKCDQRNRPDGQEANPFKPKEALPSIEDKSTNNSARCGSPTSASKIRTKINKMSGQVSDSNESDGGETARSKLGNVPVGRKLPPIQPGAEPSQPPEDTTGVKKLKKKKRKKNKEEQQNDKEDDNE